MNERRRRPPQEPNHDPAYDAETLRVWRDEAYIEATLDFALRATALQLARQAESPEVTLVDLHTARPYLKKCIENMRPSELEVADGETMSALWAAGAAGAYRRRCRRKRPREIRDGHTSQLSREGGDRSRK